MKLIVTGITIENFNVAEDVARKLRLQWINNFPPMSDEISVRTSYEDTGWAYNGFYKTSKYKKHKFITFEQFRGMVAGSILRYNNKTEGIWI
jgi:hypothetical protein